MALIVIKKSPVENISKRMWEITKPGDVIILVQDGIFWAINEKSKEYLKDGVSVYTLKEDLEARGYREEDSIYSCIDYNGWVELIEKNELIIS
uniref:Sulfurtransferase complex subunit TusB n=1 Tax=Dictyoglomus thermophilum TaxID=14 RepID=A0A7C3MJP7_DICTH